RPSAARRRRPALRGPRQRTAEARDRTRDRLADRHSPQVPRREVTTQHVAAAAPPTPASALRRHWLERAFQRARIDPSHWDPALGVDVNRRTIERVYDYYGRLYLEHPELEWAGMANMIGPSFYAGFLDIGFVPDRMRRLLAVLRRLFRTALRRIRRLFRRG